MGRGPQTEISGKSDVSGLKRSEKNICSGGPLIDDFWPIFAKISQFAEISKDLFFNYLMKIYLSQYRRIEGSAALENCFEKSTQLERSLSTFSGLSVIFLFAKWQLCEVVRITCKREWFTS